MQANLLENSLDFLLSAAEAVQRDEGPRSLKEAVLHLADASELLIKARLVQEHWSLIFLTIDQASREKLAADDLRTVDFPKAVERLKKIVDVEVDESLIEYVNKLRGLRNKLTHFTATLDVAQTRSLVSKTMRFCIEFAEQQKMVNLEAEYRLGEIHTRLVELQEFVDDRVAAIAEEWDESFIRECPNCWQTALVMDSSEANCKFCRFKTTPQQLAANAGESPLFDCPECGAIGTFVLVLFNNEDGRWDCFSCGEGGKNYGHCIRCGEMIYADPPEAAGFCDPCVEDIVAN